MPHDDPAPRPMTLPEKLWRRHLVASVPGEPDLLYIDLHLVHEVTSPQAFDGLRLSGRRVRRPDLTIATEDHNVPTEHIDRPIADEISAKQVDTLRANAAEFGVTNFPMGDPDQGIVHVIGPEQGRTMPGMTIVCGDSHTATHGAFGTGRTVWFANEIERVFYRYGFPDLGLVYANAVRYAAGGALTLEVSAPDFVDVTHMAQPERALVHLINLPVGKPLATGWRPIGRNLVPVSDIGIRLRSDGRTVAEVRRASDERPLAFVETDGWICTAVPRLDDHEIVVFEFQA